MPFSYCLCGNTDSHEWTVLTCTKLCPPLNLFWIKRRRKTGSCSSLPHCLSLCCSIYAKWLTILACTKRIYERRISFLLAANIPCFQVHCCCRTFKHTAWSKRLLKRSEVEWSNYWMLTTWICWMTELFPSIDLLAQAYFSVRICQVQHFRRLRSGLCGDQSMCLNVSRGHSGALESNMKTINTTGLLRTVAVWLTQ